MKFLLTVKQKYAGMARKKSELCKKRMFVCNSVWLGSLLVFELLGV